MIDRREQVHFVVMKNLVALLVATVVAASSAFAANVEGFVYAADGTPVDAATVAVYIAEGSAEQAQRHEKRGARTALATTKTDAGRFSFTNLPDSVVDLDVRADGFAPVVARTLADEVPVTITVQPAPLVDGRVTANGKAVADAYVIWLGANDVEFTAKTDANGRYRVPDPRRWSREPRVYHPAYATLLESGRGTESTHLELQPKTRAAAERPAGDATLSGTVRLGTKPLAGVPVIVQGTSERYFPPVRVVTDAKGRYSVSGLAPVRTYAAAGEGLEPRIRTMRGSSTEVEGSAPASADLQREKKGVADLTFEKAPIVTGRIVDADGKPVAAANVQVVLAGRTSFDFMYEAAARTFVDGRYAVALPPFDTTATLNLAVTPRRSATVRSKPFIAGTADHRIDLTLPRFETVTLRVLGNERKPVANALVAFAASDEAAAFSDSRILVSQPFAARALRTNEAGETTAQLVPGTYDFAAAADGFQTIAIAERAVARATTVDIQLEAAYTIQGRIHRNGTGVSGVTVRVLGGERAEREAPVTTNADGTFEITGLARDKYRIALHKMEELVQKIMTVEAPAKLDVALPPAGLLRVRVIDGATREPVKEFVYTVEPLEQAEESRQYGNPSLQNVVTDGTGTFTATLGAGRYRVTVGGSAYATSEPVEVRLTEREPADVQIALDRGITLSGRVLDENGSPVAEAELFASNPELARSAKRAAPRIAPGNTRSAEDGTYTLSGLDAGTIALFVRKEGFVPFRKAVETNGSTTFDVQLSRGLRLEGVVTRGGKPVAEAQIGASTAAVGGDHQPAVTDRNGRFVLQGLIAARYTVSAYHAQSHAEVRDVDPSVQKQLAISLDPKPAGVIFGTVTGLPQNASGKVVRRVVFAQNEERGTEGMIDDAGNYRIENAPVGSVFVIAQWEGVNGGRTSPRRQVNVAAGQETRVDLDLGGNIGVSGRVTHEGKPVAGARVIFTNDQGVGGSAMTRADGAYEVALPAPGTYQIFAHADRMDAQPYQSVRAIRGGETLDIDLREHVVEGMVVDAETRLPVAGAVVTLVPATTPIETVSGETMTDANGRFRILTSGAGAHRAIAFAPGYAYVEQSVTLGSESRQLAFELRRSAELRVRVIDARTSTPLEAHLILATSEGAFLPIRPDRTADGDWYVFALHEGAYRITAMVQSYKPQSVTVTAPGNVEIRME
ncbi:MAG TPA: carboxypeptidase regulatory-like domain-containing protein [Thermoanaerobaculia bacterium]|jgi:hypothetical protein